MQLDNGIAALLLVAAGIVLAVIAWAVLRKRLPPSAVELIAQAVAEIRTALGEVFTEDDATALAGWVYDSWIMGSEYYTREQFVALVVGALMRSQKSAPVMVETMQRDNARQVWLAKWDKAVGND